MRIFALSNIRIRMTEEQFYACASGQLLMLSAWEHHNDHCKVTAEQCQLMNMMALEICEQ